MSRKKTCRKCKLFVSGDTCPHCGSNAFTTSWQGRLLVCDPASSEIAQKIGIKEKGEYAIKVR